MEYWTKLGRVADENPDLPVSLIKEILIARAQVRSGSKTPYVYEFDENEVLLLALGTHENFY